MTKLIYSYCKGEAGSTQLRGDMMAAEMSIRRQMLGLDHTTTKLLEQYSCSISPCYLGTKIYQITTETQRTMQRLSVELYN